MARPRQCIVLVAAVIAGCTIGCGSGSGERSSDVAGRAESSDIHEEKAVLGSWSGEVVQMSADGQRERIAQSVSVEWKGGALTGTSDGQILTSTVRCGGRLAYQSSEVGAYVFNYTEERNRDACVDRSTVILRPRRGGLEYSELYKTSSRVGTISGKLTRRAQPARPR